MSQKIDIDFSVRSSIYFLKVLDFSSWQLIENEPAIIEITLPGYSKCITHYFDKHKVNIYNSILLDINCTEGCGETEKVSLSDGIYKIKVIGSPSKYFKEYYYLKTDAIDMEIAKAYISNIKENYNEELDNRITEIRFLLAGSTAELVYDSVKKAGEKFQLALKLTEDLNNCKSCK